MSLNLDDYPNFKADIQGRDTALIPIIKIGDIYISTNSMIYDGQPILPLLTSNPSLKESIDIDDLFAKGYSGANTTEWFDAWIKIQRGQKFLIFDVSSYRTMEGDLRQSMVKLYDGNGNVIGWKIRMGSWDSNNAAWSTPPMVQNTDFDVADSNCNSNSSPVAANEVLTITYEFRESIGSRLPNTVPDISSGEKYFLKYNEGGNTTFSGYDASWVQDDT